MLSKDDLPFCPVTTVLRLLGSKWKILIIQKLQEGPQRFGGLLRELKGISRRVLSVSLHDMEKDGLVMKKIQISDSTQRIEYHLSELGETLVPLLCEIEKWGLYYIQCLREAKR